MAFRNVVAVVTDVARDRWAMDAAVGLARRERGHLDLLCLGVDRTVPSFYYAGANAMAMQASLAEAEKRAQQTEKAVKKLMEGSDVAWAACGFTAQLPGLGTLLAHHTRLCDIAVLPRPYGKDRGHEYEAIVEAELFDARIPVLVIPEKSALPPVAARIVIAWNESREALNAVRAALPVLQTASMVNIAIVDPPAHGPDRSDPGGALAQMLSRHGVKADVSVLARTMPRVSEVIARHVADQAADLLVMGAYGHSRIRESILGGATRNILQNAQLPVLMAH